MRRSRRTTWTPLAATESVPFASKGNVTFPGGAWTDDIGHGELLRAGNDQMLTINPLPVRYVYQGAGSQRERRPPPAALADGPAHPDELGLPTFVVRKAL